MISTEKVYMAVRRERHKTNANDDFGSDNFMVEMNKDMFKTREEAVEALRKFRDLHQMINPGSTRYEYYVREITYAAKEEKLDFDNQDGET